MDIRCLNCMNKVDSQYEVCPACGFIHNTPPKELYHLHPGVQLQGRYTIGTVVGFGGFGIIYRAWDDRLDTIVAIKEYYPAGIVQRIPGEKEVIVYTGNSKKEFVNGIDRFLDEAKNMAKFSTHANIMNVYDYFEENNTAYIVMEFLDGISLKQYVKSVGGKLEIPQAIEIISSVCEALKEIHKEGIIHRDISPDNIFICLDGKIKLIDFGAARFSTGEEEKTLSIILKPGFAPPEQYRSKSKQGPWTDVYALAATLYRIVTGVVPDESVNRIVEDNLQTPDEINKEISENFSNALMKGMALNQDLRFQSIAEFQDAILDKKKVTNLKEELKRRKQKRVIGIVAASIVLLCGGVFAYHSFSNKRKQVDLPNTTISIWVPVKSREDEEESEEMLEAMIEQFKLDQPAVQVEITCIPWMDYENRLLEAKEEGNFPTIYASDLVSNELLEGSASIDEVYNYIDLNEYYYLNEYKKNNLKATKIPMGFAAPVVYVRRGMDVDIDTEVIDSFEQLEASTYKGNTINYYIEDEVYEELFSTFTGQDINASELNETALEYANSYALQLATVGCTPGNDLRGMSDFISGDITYYIGTTKDFTLMNQKMAGMYEMRPINNDVIVGNYTNCFSISGEASKDDQHAASVLLAYMLAAGPQKTMHIIHKNAIPLHKDAYEAFVNNNGKFEIITEYYLDKIEFVRLKNEEMYDSQMMEILGDQISLAEEAN